jgi:hypothetical protein
MGLDESGDLIVNSPHFGGGSFSQTVTAAGDSDQLVLYTGARHGLRHFVGFFVGHVRIRRTMHEDGWWIGLRYVPNRKIALKPGGFPIRIVAGYLLRPQTVLAAL